LSPGLARIVCLAGLALALVAGCGPSSPAERPFVVAIDTRPRTLDPRLATSDIDGRVTRLLWAGLTTVDTPDAAPAPLLAARVTRRDPQVVEVELRAGLRFHDGTPLDVDDVRCTVASLSDPAVGSPFAGDWAATRIEQVDSRVLRFVTDAPDPSLEVRLDLGIVPCELAGAPIDDAGAARAGSGPWRLIAREREGSLLLHAAETWHEGAPPLGQVALRVVPDATARLLGLRSGTIDAVQNGVAAPLLEVVARDPSLRILRADALRTTYLVLQLERPPFDDPAVRRALALAVDADALVAHRLGGHAIRASGMLPPAHWAFRTRPSPTRDLTAAVRELEEAGYVADGDGCRVRGELSSSSNRLYRGIAEVLAAQARDAGICLAPRASEWSTYFASVKAGAFDAALLQWTSIVDPAHYRWAFHSESIPSAEARSSGGNRGRWRNPDVDALLDRARTETDADARADLFARVDDIAASELPYVYLWHEDNVLVVRADVEGAEPVPTGRFSWLAAARRTAAPR
jgi:peptide/nickel transport system substrate-binding protein